MAFCSWGRVGLVLAEGDSAACWFEEAAVQSGLMAEIIPMSRFDRVLSCQVVVLCGNGELTLIQKGVLHRAVTNGAVVVVSGGVWGLHTELGLSDVAQPHFAKSWMTPICRTGIWPETTPKALFFGGARRTEASAATLCRGPGGECLVATNGQWLWFAPHLGLTLSTILMGAPVECDGIGPGDGSCDLLDGKLRAEDGTRLDFKEDREQQHFSRPWADILRDIWMRIILMACDQAMIDPPLISSSPGGFEATACLTIETHPSNHESTRRFQRSLGKFGFRAGWFSSGGSMPADITRVLKSQDHSFGLLFQGHSEAFHEDLLKVQMLQSGRQLGTSTLPCSRLADGGWEGWDKYYEMVEKVGSRASMAKGGRQKGTAGFLFGTSMPFQTYRRDGGKRKTLEIPYQACLPETPDPYIPNLASQAFNHGGCFQCAIDLRTAKETDIDRSLLNLNMVLRQKRLQVVTPDQLVSFELARRGLQIITDGSKISLQADSAVPGLTVLAPKGSALSGTLPVTGMREFSRFGRVFNAVTFDLGAKAHCSWVLEPKAEAA